MSETAICETELLNRLAAGEPEAIPIAENLTNPVNYLDALQRQGFAESTGDNLLTRVWWDKQ